MPKKTADGDLEGFTAKAEKLLAEKWTGVSADAEDDPQITYLDDAKLADVIRQCVNHKQVGYRFCLPVQLLGKLTNQNLDCLALQRRKEGGDERSWDARSLASKVIAPFNARQESVLGSASDPYVGNAMRIPRMLRSDSSKRDLAGWNMLIDVLETVEQKNSVVLTDKVFKQVLLELHRRQKGLQFSYPVPPRISLDTTLKLAEDFLSNKSGGDRALALVGALFDVIGMRFKLFAQVNRARINASDEASGQAADLECLDEDGNIVLAVEVKDRALKLADVEGTLTKARHRSIREILFAAPKVDTHDNSEIKTRISTAFSGGQNLYMSDFFELARVVLALGGESMRSDYLRQVGSHLDLWNTQPSHRQAWKKLLESV